MLPAVVANVALATVPDTFAPATLFAVSDVVACVAFATVPYTLAPVIELNALPLPLNELATILALATRFGVLTFMSALLLSVRPPISSRI